MKKKEQIQNVFIVVTKVKQSVVTEINLWLQVTMYSLIDQNELIDHTLKNVTSDKQQRLLQQVFELIASSPYKT